MVIDIIDLIDVIDTRILKLGSVDPVLAQRTRKP